MGGETIRLAEFAAQLQFEALPAPVVQRAKDAIADTIAIVGVSTAVSLAKANVTHCNRFRNATMTKSSTFNIHPTLKYVTATSEWNWNRAITSDKRSHRS